MFGIIPSFTAPSIPDVPAFAPTDLGTTVLRAWYTPQGAKWQDSARSTPATGTAPVGAWDDSSGAGRHILQATSGLRPPRTTSGAVALPGGVLGWMDIPPMGSEMWADDFAIYLVQRTTTWTNDHARYLDVAYDSHIAVIQPHDSFDTPGLQTIKFSCVDPGSPYGLTSTHEVHDAISVVRITRIGTTQGIKINGNTVETKTTSGSALSDSAVRLGARLAFGDLGAAFECFEMAFLANPTGDQLDSMDAYFAARLAGGAYT